VAERGVNFIGEEVRVYPFLSCLLRRVVLDHLNCGNTILQPQSEGVGLPLDRWRVIIGYSVVGHQPISEANYVWVPHAINSGASYLWGSS
jgi:hypothetical protein